MPTATEPAKPTPPTGPEIKLGVAAAGAAGRVNPSVVEAIKAAAAKNAPQEPVPIEPPPEPPPTAATPPAPTAAQPEAKVEPKSATPPVEEPKGIKQVRDALERRTREYEELKTSHSSTAKERADALAKMAELETKLAKVTDEVEKDLKPRAAKLAEVEKRLVEKEEILRIKDYQSTDHFHNTYVKPIADAHAEAASYMAQLTVNGDDGSVRQATTDDLNEILAARSLNDAAALAQQKFGPLLASTIVNMKVRLNGLERQRHEAVKNAGIESQKWVESQQIQHNQNKEQFRNGVFSEANRLLSESPHLRIADDDEEGKATINAATEFANSLWEENHSQTPEQVAKKLAQVRLDVIESRVLRSKVSKQAERIKELETRLSDYEASEPELKPRGAGATLAVGDDSKSKLLAAANALAAKRG